MACLHVNVTVAVRDDQIDLISIMLRAYADQRAMQALDATAAGDEMAARWAMDSKADATNMAERLEAMLAKKVEEVEHMAQFYAENN